MYISLHMSRTTGFRKWADVHQPMSDQPATTAPPSPAQGSDLGVTIPYEHPVRPWLIPGVGTAF